MYTLLRTLTAREALLQRLPALVVSLAIANAFYKFGSFLPEALAFLVTWFVVDALGDLVFRRGRDKT